MLNFSSTLIILFNVQNFYNNISFTVETKFFYALQLTSMVAIPLEWCRARYPLVEVNDDDFRKSNDDDFRKDYDDDCRGNFYLSCFS